MGLFGNIDFLKNDAPGSSKPTVSANTLENGASVSSNSINVSDMGDDDREGDDDKGKKLSGVAQILGNLIKNSVTVSNLDMPFSFIDKARAVVQARRITGTDENGDAYTETEDGERIYNGTNDNYTMIHPGGGGSQNANSQHVQSDIQAGPPTSHSPHTGMSNDLPRGYSAYKDINNNFVLTVSKNDTDVKYTSAELKSNVQDYVFNKYFDDLDLPISTLSKLHSGNSFNTSLTSSQLDTLEDKCPGITDAYNDAVHDIETFNSYMNHLANPNSSSYRINAATLTEGKSLLTETFDYSITLDLTKSNPGIIDNPGLNFKPDSSKTYDHNSLFDRLNGVFNVAGTGVNNVFDKANDAVETVLPEIDGPTFNI